MVFEKYGISQFLRHCGIQNWHFPCARHSIKHPRDTSTTLDVQPIALTVDIFPVVLSRKSVSNISDVNFFNFYLLTFCMQMIMNMQRTVQHFWTYFCKELWHILKLSKNCAIFFKFSFIGCIDMK